MNRQRICKSAFFGHWSKAKSVVKSGQVSSGSGFRSAFWLAQGCPTKRAADWWDSAAFSGIFLASSFSCSQTLPYPSHQRLTPAVRRFLLNCSKGVGLRHEAVKVEQQGSFSQVEFLVGQVGSFGSGGFGYSFRFQVRG